MEKIDVEKIVIVAVAVVATLFILTVAFCTESARVTDKQKYDACISKGGSWIPVSSDGICIMRGSF